MPNICTNESWCNSMSRHFTGANVNATTGTGDTPLSFACENGHTDVADILLEAGAELVRINKHFR